MQKPAEASPKSTPPPVGNEAPLPFLEQEARRVAAAMADIRKECMEGLEGKSIPRPAEEATPLPGPGGPLGFSPFYYYPFLFADAFPPLSLDTLRTLSLSSRILLEAILLTDRQIDESRRWSPEDLFLVDIYHHRAMQTLLPLFPPDHPFWSRAEICFLRYARSVLQEQFRHRHRVLPYTRREFFSLSSGKVALIQTTLHAMASLSDHSAFLTPLISSQNLFLVGFQAFDDLKDWKEDLRNQNFTHLLTRVFLRGGFRERLLRDDPPSTLEVGTVLYCQGIAGAQLERAENYFQRALSRVRDVPVPMWKEVVKGFRKSCRDMRRDFTEIRRRNSEQVPGDPPGECGTGGHRPRVSSRAEQTPSMAWEPEELRDRVGRALLYLKNKQAPGGGFPLYASPCAYMNPASSLPLSRGATRLVQRSLAPLRDLVPFPGELAARYDRWLARPESASQDDPGLPTAFEQAFPFFSHDPELPASREGAVPDAPPLAFNGLLWAERLDHARQRKIRLPELERFSVRCIRSADFSRWDRLLPAGPEGGNGPRAICRPFLPLFLLLQAPGPDLFDLPLRETVRDYLAGRYRAMGGWGNVTDTSLHLLCLQTAGYTGRAMHRGAERLLHLQEPDGSWPPNAFYKQDDLYYGSREVTTAWCAAALFLHAWGRGAPAKKPQRPHIPSRKQVPEPYLHRDIPTSVKLCAMNAVQRLTEYLPRERGVELYLGTWASMPPHFLLPDGDRLRVGVNLTSPGRIPALSTGPRPLESEIVLALLSAARFWLRGPLNDRLERIYILGLALAVCEQLWPERPFQVHAGLHPLDDRWCREHEPYLWVQIRDFLTHADPGHGPFRWLLPSSDTPTRGPIPRGASLYMGRTLFQGLTERGQLNTQEVNDFLGAGPEEILQAFRTRTGAAPGKLPLFRKDVHETQTV